MKYYWDKNKAKANIESPNVSFEEAVLVFTNEWAIEEFDDSHSISGEQRFTLIGLAKTRLLRVTYRVEKDLEGQESVKIISARCFSTSRMRDYMIGLKI